MKLLKNNLTVIAFVVAVFSAFAFSSLDPEPNPDLMIFGQLADGSWVEAEANPICDDSDNICLAQFENDDPEFGDRVYEKSGDYIPQ